jgi:hypothetical protein
MSGDEFVRTVEKCVRDAAVKSTLANLRAPPGRAPNPELVKASQWFLSLAENDRSTAEWVIRWAADHATFNFLAVLDGACAVEAGPEKGTFELYYVRGSFRRRLNDISTDEPLNDKFRL